MNDAIAIDLRKALERFESVQLLAPGEAGYEEGRQVYNRLHDLHPCLIVRTLDPLAIRALLAVARSHRIELAIRGGGHHIAGFGGTEGGVLLDFSPFKGVQLDEESGIARVQPGVRLRDIDAVLCPRGYVVPTGTVSDTGIAGLTLGGGIGWFVATLGFTCENLVGADVMLASGEVVRAEDAEHQDLLWALRGGGGNFGVVLEFRYRVSRLPRVRCGSIEIPGADVSRLFPHLVAYMEQRCPPELVLAPVFTPAEGAGMANLSVDFCLSGEDIAPLVELEAALGVPSGGHVITETFQAWQSWFDERFMPPMRGYWKSASLDAFGAGSIDAVLTAVASMPGRRCSITIEHLNGRRYPIAKCDAVFPLRSKSYNILISARWPEARDDGVFIGWVKEAAVGVERSGAQMAYSNYSFAQELPRQRLFGSEHDRLLSIKRRYDGDNIFRRNHNIGAS